MNQISIRGVMGQAPKSFQVEERLKVSFSIAYRSSKEAKTQWFNIEAWGEVADQILNNTAFNKGKLVDVHGYIKQSSYTNKEGVKVYQVTINAKKIEIFEKALPSTATHRSQGTQAYSGGAFEQDDLPF